MSIRLMTAVWRTELPSHLKLTLLALADWANDEGICYPGQASIGQRCSTSERQARSNVSKLIELGYVELERRRFQSSNVYRISVELLEDRKQTSGIRPEAENLPDRKRASSKTGSRLPANRQKNHQKNRHDAERDPETYLPAERWARRWCELRDLPATRPVVRRFVGQVNEFLEAGGEPSEELLERALSAGIETPAGWGFVASKNGRRYPAWVVGSILRAVENPNATVDPRWLAEFDFGPAAPIPPEKIPVIRAKQTALRLARSGEKLDERRIRTLLDTHHAGRPI